MATPFAPFANVRLLWRRPLAAPMGLREGISGQQEQVVLEAFGKQGGVGGEQASGGRQIASGSATLYITRWTVLAPGQHWLDPGEIWDWDETGLRPTGLPRGEKLEAFWGDLAILPELTDGEQGWFTIASMPGPGGIDALVRAAAGDKLTGTFAAGR